jgi:pyridine nucleotide-disulfide oxidoreductase family protein
MQKKKLILLGGGHAHVHVLASLADMPLMNAEVTLVSPYSRQVYSGMLPGWVAGHYALSDCIIPLMPWVKRTGIQYRRAAATAIDPAARKVTLDSGEVLDYDVLSIDTGTQFDPDAIAGARAHGLLVRPIESFISAWQEKLPVLQAQASPRIVMVGGGAAGIELLLAMQHAMPQAQCALVSAANTLPGSVGPRLARILGERSIALHAGTGAKAIHANSVELTDGNTLDSDCTVVAIGATAGFLIPATGLARDERGFIETNSFLQSTSHPEIFAAGDCASMRDHPRPKSGVYAVRAGPPLAANIRKALAGEPLAGYTPQERSLYLIATGPKYAIGSWGSWAWQGGWVWRWKDRIDRAFMRRYASSETG